MALTLLIVDDENEILLSLSRFFGLQDIDLDLVTARNGQEALNIIEEKNVDVALLDINMPEMDGLELLHEIKKRDYSIQVIMMTAYSTFDKTLRSIELGAVDYILKPFDSLDYVFEVVNESILRLTRWNKDIVEYAMVDEKESNKYS